ncbi:hypothetical protein NG859_05395 [Enterococcus faecalis]|uniref:hypothetical protein n=1 Tax=Enterococcus faecalis TaxID=1351 RepID=UPI001A0FA6CA|nr:hypothetical protein [Enterococcus faecalis]EGO9128012.1 hypothetical protein [Enterococcus faecalis]MCO5421197.1 hypothetical protein [Enterococcus faecalis]
MTEFGNVAYQKMSGDWQLEDVPNVLWELRLSPNELSFVTLSIQYDSDIDSMTLTELEERISNEYHHIESLESIFSHIKKQNVKNQLEPRAR